MSKFPKNITIGNANTNKKFKIALTTLFSIKEKTIPIIPKIGQIYTVTNPIGLRFPKKSNWKSFNIKAITRHTIPMISVHKLLFFVLFINSPPIFNIIISYLRIIWYIISSKKSVEQSTPLCLIFTKLSEPQLPRHFQQ